MKIIPLLLLASILVYVSSSGQGFRVYRGGANSTDSSIREFTKVLALPDGNIVYAGQADEGSDANFSLTKTNPEGAIIWQQSFGTPALDVINNLAPSSDGGFICVGWTTNTESPADAADGLIVKTNGLGVPEWSKQWRGPDDDEIKGVTQLSNGDFLVVGTTFSFGSVVRSAFAARLDPSGELVWSRVYSQGLYNYFFKPIPLADNQAMLCGYTWVTTSNTVFDPFFARIDSDGSLVWARRIRLPGSQTLYDYELASDGGVYYGGVTSATPTQNILGKVGPDGTHQFARAFGTPNPDRIWDLSLLSDGQLMAAGFTGKTSSDLARRNSFMARLSPEGLVQEAILVGNSDTNSTVFTGLATRGDFVVATGLTYGWGNTRGGGLSMRLVGGNLNQNCEALPLSMAISQTYTNVTDSSGGVSQTAGNLIDADVSNAENNLEVQTICTFTSLEKRMRESGFRMRFHPDPGLLEMENSGSESVRYRLVSSTGKICFEGNLPAGRQATVSTLGMPAGIYRMQSFSPGSSQSAVLLIP